MKNIIYSILIVVVFLPIENYFSEESLYSTNWVISALFYLISWISIIISVVFIWCNFFKASIAILTLGILLVVPFNIYLLNDLRILKSESDRIVNVAYKHKLKNGNYPKQIHSKDTRVKYLREKDGSFTVSFYVYVQNAGHFYTPEDGWCFMDD